MTRQKHLHLHLTDLLTCRKCVSNCKCVSSRKCESGRAIWENVTKIKYVIELWLCRNTEIQPISHQHLAMLIMSKYLTGLSLLKWCSFPLFVLSWNRLWWRRSLLESCRLWEHPRGRLFHKNFKITSKSFFLFYLQPRKTILERLLSYKVAFVRKCKKQCQNKWNKDF